MQEHGEWNWQSRPAQGHTPVLQHAITRETAWGQVQGKDCCGVWISLAEQSEVNVEGRRSQEKRNLESKRGSDFRQSGDSADKSAFITLTTPCCIWTSVGSPRGLVLDLLMLSCLRNDIALVGLLCCTFFYRFFFGGWGYGSRFKLGKQKVLL